MVALEKSGRFRQSGASKWDKRHEAERLGTGGEIRGAFEVSVSVFQSVAYVVRPIRRVGIPTWHGERIES
jgi:hypothetical protein